MESYPPELVYNNINPKGFFSSFKEWLIEPIASGGTFWPGENIRILIQSVISGVMDPYRSHLELEVELNPGLLPVGALQVDSSAQSFIEQLVINSKNKEIERIPEYSVLAAWLSDCGLSEMYAEGRETEGLGYTNVENISANSKNATFGSNSQYGQYETNLTADNQGLCYVPNFPTVFPTQRSGGVFENGSPLFISKVESSRNIKGHVGHHNSAWYQNDVEQKWVPEGGKQVSRSALNRTGYLRNMRAEYLESILSSNYTDSTQSKSQFDIRLQSNVFNGDPLAVYEKGESYNTRIPNQFNLNYQVSATGNAPINYVTEPMPNTTALAGYSCLYSPNFCKGVREPFISETIPQCQMKNGKILPEKIPITKRTFKIPIISAILGLLIPEDQFVLLPIRALNEVLMEFVIDKYAMFTSGYNDMTEFDDAGMLIQQERCFKIRKCTYKMHTYQFYDPSIDKYLSDALMTKIVLNVNMWTLGNQYQVTKGENINNTWQVACTSEALNEIVVLFVPLDYQRYSFCRKHFRISNNITKFQLRINMEYFPSQPILGNGGNPCEIEGVDNSAFIEQIFWSNNFMFNKVNPWPRINSYNFAINERCYDITRTATFYDPAIKPSGTTDKTGYVWTQNSVNQDTALGMPFIHENRYVGKAGYVYGFEPYAHSAYHLTGLDCRQVRQFDVLLNTHPQDNFPREQTMYIFTRSSCIVEFTENGINVYGR